MPAVTMSTATTTTPPPPQPWYRPNGVMEPFSTAITAAEHKIRNLEKRKLKLDQYRNEQADGKTLNSDQLNAVAKYNEVIQQLENNRELVMSLRQVHQQTIKYIKQELRRENAERNKSILAMQAAMDQLQNPNVQRDFLNGEHGAPKINQEDLVELTEIYKLLRPSLREPDSIESGAELLSKLLESRGKINNRPSQEVKSLIDSIVESQYFVSSVPIEPVPIEPVQVQEVSQQDCRTEMPLNNIGQGNEMPYSFMQESQLDIESPHMDPAVVAVSSYPLSHPLPPPQQPHLPEKLLIQEDELKKDQPGSPQNGTNGNLEANPIPLAEQDNTNKRGFPKRGGRGGRRGTGFNQGRGNGYNQGRGNGYNPRIPRGTPRGGYNNKGGHFRVDNANGINANLESAADHHHAKAHPSSFSRPYNKGSGPCSRNNHGAAPRSSD